MHPNLICGLDSAWTRVTGPVADRPAVLLVLLPPQSGPADADRPDGPPQVVPAIMWIFESITRWHLHTSPPTSIREARGRAEVGSAWPGATVSYASPSIVLLGTRGPSRGTGPRLCRAVHGKPEQRSGVCLSRARDARPSPRTTHGRPRQLTPWDGVHGCAGGRVVQDLPLPGSKGLAYFIPQVEESSCYCRSGTTTLGSHSVVTDAHREVFPSCQLLSLLFSELVGAATKSCACLTNASCRPIYPFSFLLALLCFPLALPTKMKFPRPGPCIR